MHYFTQGGKGNVFWRDSAAHKFQWYPNIIKLFYFTFYLTFTYMQNVYSVQKAILMQQ